METIEMNQAIKAAETRVSQLENKLQDEGIDLLFRVRMMTGLIAIYKTRLAALHAYETILSDAVEIFQEAEALLDTSDDE